MTKRQEESKIKNQIFQFIEAQSYWKIVAWNNQSVGVYDPTRKIYRKNNSKYSRNGVSDIIGICEGIPLFIEVKTQVGRLSKSQKIFLQDMRDHGAIAFVARSVEDVQENIDREFKRRLGIAI